MKGLVASIELLDDGGTVPFIARYRKEATGNLDEGQIRSTSLASIDEQGKLTPEVKARIEATLKTAPSRSRLRIGTEPRT